MVTGCWVSISFTSNMNGVWWCTRLQQKCIKPSFISYLAILAKWSSKAITGHLIIGFTKVTCLDSHFNASGSSVCEICGCHLHQDVAVVDNMTCGQRSPTHRECYYALVVSPPFFVNPTPRSSLREARRAQTLPRVLLCRPHGSTTRESLREISPLLAPVWGVLSLLHFFVAHLVHTCVSAGHVQLDSQWCKAKI